MSEDSYTEVTHQSWFGRLGNALKGIVFGLLLFLGSFPLLFWNEGRAVETYKTLVEGAAAVISIVDNSIDPANIGQLVHVSGMALTKDVLTDTVFGISTTAIKLMRQVKMYQWQESSSSETQKKLGGGTETITTYNYDKVWADHWISSSRFKKPSGHSNPDSIPYQQQQWIAQDVRLGAFRLPSFLINKVSNSEILELDDGLVAFSDAERQVHVNRSEIYIGDSPSLAEIGDLKINFQVVKPANVSIIANQSSNSFEPYQAEAGGTIELLQMGLVSAPEMFAKAQQENTILTWILRGLGLFLMFFGLKMIFQVISVVADVIPLLGNVAGAGINIIAFLLAAILSLTTIAVAWIYYRPLLGAGLLVFVAGLIWWTRGRLKTASIEPPAISSPPPPPPPTVA